MSDGQRRRPRMLQIVGETDIDFLGKRRVAYTVSIVLVILGLIAGFQIFVTGNANLGIEFTGGTSVTLDFDQEIPIAEARRALAEQGLPNAQVTTAESADAYRLIVQLKEGAVAAGEQEVGETAERIRTILSETFPDASITDSSHTSIGPAVGAELRQKAIWAILIAIAVIIGYVAIRFDYKFGVAATAAMTHDVLAVIGLMWLKDFIVPTEFTLLIMTAVLTLSGYSLSDTVVLFDRVRENLRKHQRRSLLDQVNDSVNQMLSRTIVTSVTTLAVVVSILVLGGPVLRDFALALTFGILIGTYSSIFVAGPLLVLWSGGGGRLVGQTTRSRSRESEASRQGEAEAEGVSS